MLAFDTLKYTKRLEDAGVPRKQAEAQAEITAEAFEDVIHDSLATKEDIRDLEKQVDDVEESLGKRIDDIEQSLGKRIDEVEQSLGKRIDEVEQSLRKRIDDVEQSLGKRIDKLEQKFIELEQKMATYKVDIIKWMITLLFGQTALILTLLKYLH